MAVIELLQMSFVMDRYPWRFREERRPLVVSTRAGRERVSLVCFIICFIRACRSDGGHQKEWQMTAHSH